jgi:8-hydroxy-5-deazaflavin:NADPH oxidoreductase
MQLRSTLSEMRIAIIGTGRMGKGFATALSPHHDVVLGSRDPRRAGDVVAKTGATQAVSYTEAAAGAEVVILTVPWNAMDETLSQVGDLNGTVVIDVSFPYKKSERQALENKGTSTAEDIQARLTRARVFKGWNHIHARDLVSPELDGIAPSVLIAGDDPAGKKVVFELARDMGFDPVDVGPLRATRELERLVSIMLFIRLGPLRVLSRP